MKEGIHPKYHAVEVRCACGATWKTRSTKPELHLEICSSCHPFFTGKQKLLDTEGRVERFTKKFGAQTSRKPQEGAAAASKSQEARGGRPSLDSRFSSSSPTPPASPSFRSIRARRRRAVLLPPIPRHPASHILEREHPRRLQIAPAVFVMNRERLDRLALDPARTPVFNQRAPAAGGFVESPRTPIAR